MCVGELLVACGCLLPRARTMTTLSTLSLWKKNLLTGRSSSATRGSLAPLGEKDHNRRWVSEGEDAPYIRYGRGGGRKQDAGRFGTRYQSWQRKPYTTRDSEKQRGSYDSVGLIIAVTVNTNIVCIGGNNRSPLPTLHPPSQSRLNITRGWGEMGGVGGAQLVYVYRRERENWWWLSCWSNKA